jgi:hypothetical protein
MVTAPEIAELAAKELSALKSYELAAANHTPDADILVNCFRDFSSQRKTAYAHFRMLA